DPSVCVVWARCIPVCSSSMQIRRVGGGVSVRLHALMVGFLEHVRDALRSALPESQGEDFEAMIAVPAGASSAQRLFTLAAFRDAGFTVTGILNEPSAAAIEYAHRYRKSVTSRREDVLVYDLGGGTFDASLVRMSEDRHEVLAHTGLGDVGGADFDVALLRLGLAAAGRSDLDDAEHTRLLEHAREQKEGLNPNSRKVLLELGEHDVKVPVQDFYAACAPSITRTLDVLTDLLPTGTDERFDTTGLAGVYVVGGGSDLPAVARQLKEVFGRRVKRSQLPSAATAVGLALAQQGDTAPALDERFSRNFGVFRELESGDRIAFDPILTADLPVPDQGIERTRRYRAAHNIGWLRFVECDRLGPDDTPDGDVTAFAEVRVAYDPDLRGRDLSQVPVKRLNTPGSLIEETYRVDPEGVVQVRIADLETGYAVEARLR
ncbi:MAG: Hsp70 family protein, partial [Myxococcota bacterium]